MSLDGAHLLAKRYCNKVVTGRPFPPVDHTLTASRWTPEYRSIPDRPHIRLEEEPP